MLSQQWPEEIEILGSVWLVDRTHFECMSETGPRPGTVHQNRVLIVSTHGDDPQQNLRRLCTLISWATVVELELQAMEQTEVTDETKLLAN
jgi:hypothetical protein